MFGFFPTYRAASFSACSKDAFVFILTGCPTLLPLFFAVVGIGCSAYHPSGTAVVSQGIRARGRALGTLGIWGNAGTAAAPFAVGLLNFLVGWRIGVVALGIVGAILVVVALITPFSVEKDQDRKIVKGLEKNVALRLFVVFCVGLIFNGLMYRCFTVLMPAYLEHRLSGFTENLRALLADRFVSLGDVAAFNTFTATLVATAIYLVCMLGQMIGGRVADRFSLKWAYFVYFVFALPFIIGVALLPSLFLVFSAGIFVLFTHRMQPIENSLLAYLTPARCAIGQLRPEVHSQFHLRLVCNQDGARR